MVLYRCQRRPFGIVVKALLSFKWLQILVFITSASDSNLLFFTARRAFSYSLSRACLLLYILLLLLLLLYGERMPFVPITQLALHQPHIFLWAFYLENRVRVLVAWHWCWSWSTCGSSRGGCHELKKKKKKRRWNCTQSKIFH